MVTATGTTATPGPATRASASPPSSPQASLRRHVRSWPGSCMRVDCPARDFRCCSPSTGGAGRVRTTLPGWPGYGDSRPVRIGNAAADQHQLDGYGWVLDAAWQLTDAGHRLYGETWRVASAYADQVSTTWSQPDAGIWEKRAKPAHHVHSKLMAWVALDRAIRIADSRGDRRRQRQLRWARARDALAEEIRCSRVRLRPGRLHGRLRHRPNWMPRCSPCPCLSSNRLTVIGSSARSTRFAAASEPAGLSCIATRRARTAFWERRRLPALLFLAGASTRPDRACRRSP